MSEEKKEKETDKKKTSSKVNVPAQAAPARPRGDAEARAEAAHAPSKQPPAAAKAAAPKPPAAAKAAAAAKPAAPKPTGKIRIRQTKSGICAPVDQKQTLFGLGLRRIRQEVVRLDTPAIRGQVHKVRHLVEIVESGAAR